MHNFPFVLWIDEMMKSKTLIAPVRFNLPK